MAATAEAPEDLTHTVELVTVPIVDDIEIAPVDVLDVPDDDAAESFLDTLQRVQVDDVQASNVQRRPHGRIDHPELPEDFVRNFLFRKGMAKALAAFQSEWYEKEFEEEVGDPAAEVVPDCYLAMAKLEETVRQLQHDIAAIQAKGAGARKVAEKLKEERDYHRLCHRQVKQDKRQLQQEVTHLKSHYTGLEDKVADLEKKYRKASVAKNNAMHDLEKSMNDVNDMMTLSQKVLNLSQDAPSTSTDNTDRKSQQNAAPQTPSSVGTRPRLPTRGNTALPQTPATILEQWDEDEDDAPALDHRRLELASTFRAHSVGVSAVTANRQGSVLGTAADDGSFKTWDTSTGELLLDCYGHDTWVSSCKFHPSVHVAATASGDTTVKLWSLEDGESLTTFSDHAFAVWDIDFHCTGSFLVSGSMDNTIKLWDLNQSLCRTTLRGHQDSVNSVNFQSNSNMLVSASADKTCSMWDLYTGLKVLTLTGHKNSCNHAVFSPQNDRIASVDADGVVNIWEIRTSSILASITASKGQSANKCAFDSTGDYLSVACDDNTVKVYDSNSLKLISELKAHSEPVQSVCYAGRRGPIVSGGTDGTVRLWK